MRILLGVPFCGGQRSPEKFGSVLLTCNIDKCCARLAVCYAAANSTFSISVGSSASAFELLTRLHRETRGQSFQRCIPKTMRVKLAPLISAISAIAVLSVSPTYAAVTVASGSGSGLSAAQPLANKADTIVAQAWWDAAANAANAQQQVTTGQGPPPVRRGTQRYRR